MEQKHLDQFKQLNSWVVSNKGVPTELKVLEKCADEGTVDMEPLQAWNSPDLLQLLATEPKFSEVAMKELFWVSRDNLIDEMSGLSLMSTRVKNIFNNAYSAASDTIREEICKVDVKGLSAKDIEDFFDLLESKLLLAANDKNAYHVYYFCIMHDIPRAYARWMEILQRIDVTQIPFSLGNKFNDILGRYGEDKKLLNLLKKNVQLMRAMERGDETTKK